MKFQRLITAWAASLAVIFGASAVTAVAASAATNGSAVAAKHKAKAKHKKKHPQKLTRARKLERALKKCDKAKSKKKRSACEKRALNKYGKTGKGKPGNSGNPGSNLGPPTRTVTVTVPGPKETVPGPKETVPVPGPKVEVNPIKEAEEKIAKEEAALAKVGATPSEAKEAGGTTPIESAAAIPAAPAFTNEQLDAYSSGNWLTSQGGNSGDRYSLLNEINTSNVKNLKPNWMTQLDGSADTSTYGGEAPAAEYDGVLYYATGAGDVFAVSVKSGKILWVHLGELNASGIKVCCDRDSRGVTLAEGKVYVGLVNSGVEALEMKTGKLVWYAEVGYETEGYAVTAAPLYYDGLIFIGPTGSEENVRGFMAAYNAKTGELVWKKYNIPGPGEPGHESWPTGTSCFICNYTWASGGATTWQAPVVDPETGDIIYPTANASSQFGADYFGQNRGGSNLWTDSVIARHPLTGEIAWGYQTTHHDIWDYDNSTSSVMINTEIGGKKVTGVAEASKNAYPYYLEATTGKPMTGAPDLGIEEKAVPQSEIQKTYPTQPIPKMAPVNRLRATPGEIAEAQAALSTKTNEETFATEGGVPKVVNGGYGCPHNENICPEGEDVFQLWGNFPEPEVVIGQGGNSGDRQGEPAYNPKLGIWYTCASEELEVMDINPLTYRSEMRFATPSEKLVGYINAYNMKTGELLWSKEWPHECYSGFLTTSGELLFTVTATGQFIAYNAKTGEQLWEFGEESNVGEKGTGKNAFKYGNPGLGAGGAAPSIAFEFEGKEYIVVYAGGGTLGSLTPGDFLWEFSLSGSGAEKPIPEGEGPPPPTELCAAKTGCAGY